jgi:hypothetical protein
VTLICDRRNEIAPGLRRERKSEITRGLEDFTLYNHLMLESRPYTGAVSK